MDRDDALSTDTPSPDTTDPLTGTGPGRGPGSGSARKGTGPTGDPSADPAIDPWAPLAALVAAFEASARLQPALDKALLWAGRGWLDLLGQGGGGYSLDHLKAAGVQLAWMKGDKKVPKLVDQVALLRGHPAMPKREGRISTLEPIGRKPKGWKPVGLELRRGLPTTADASPAASAAKALAGHLAARREDPSAFQPIDRQNPATEQALDVLRQWLTILATPSGARGEIDVPRFGWNEPVLALLDALGIRGQAVRDSGGRMSYIHVLLRDAVAFERYHDTMGLPVPELPADPTADATLTALDDWFNAPDADRTADGANADSEPVDTAGTLVGGGGAEGGGVDGAGRGLEGAAGDDTLASSPAGDTGPVSGTVIGPITGAVTGGGRAVGPEAENDPGLVALLQLFLGEVDLAWPEGMPRSGADRKERRGQMARGPEPYPFTPAIDGIATDALFTAIALWTITQPETAWSTLSRQHRRQTLRALKKSPNNVSHLATIRQNGAPWTALATQAGYANRPLKPIGTPPETPMAILLPFDADQGEAPLPRADFDRLSDAVQEAVITVGQEMRRRMNSVLRLESISVEREETGPTADLKIHIGANWIGGDRRPSTRIVTQPESGMPSALVDLLRAERDAALKAEGKLKIGLDDTVAMASTGTSLWRDYPHPSGSLQEMEVFKNLISAAAAGSMKTLGEIVGGLERAMDFAGPQKAQAWEDELRGLDLGDADGYGRLVARHPLVDGHRRSQEAIHALSDIAMDMAKAAFDDPGTWTPDGLAIAYRERVRPLVEGMRKVDPNTNKMDPNRSSGAAMVRSSERMLAEAEAVLGASAGVAHWVGAGITDLVMIFLKRVELPLDLVMTILSAYEDKGSIDDILEALAIKKIVSTIHGIIKCGPEIFGSLEMRDALEAQAEKVAGYLGVSIPDKSTPGYDSLWEAAWAQVKDVYAQMFITDIITPPDISDDKGKED